MFLFVVDFIDYAVITKPITIKTFEFPFQVPDIRMRIGIFLKLAKTTIQAISQGKRATLVKLERLFRKDDFIHFGGLCARV